MDPSLDPNFVPPNAHSPQQRERRFRTAPHYQIPNVSPILPYVLEELAESELDLPPTLANAPPEHQWSSELPGTLPIPEDVPPTIPRSNAMSSPPDYDSRPMSTNADHPSSTSASKNGSSHGEGSPYLHEPSGVRPVVRSADLEEVPSGVPRQAKKLEDYEFPTHRLSEVMMDENKSPLVLVACGSFSPITYLHLRMFEMAIDQIREQTRFEIIGGYYSPVSDNYNKPGLAAASHRVRMCELACERTSSWLMVDAWESLQPTYTRTALVLDHFNREINIKRGGVATSSGKRKGVKIMLLAGGDLIESMGEPNVWAEEDLHHILGRYGCIIVERTGSDVRSFLLSHDIMYEHRRNVLVIKQLIYNDISSTKVRLFIRRGMSVQYLLPNSVIRYIMEHGLYKEPEPVKQVMSERGD